MSPKEKMMKIRKAKESDIHQLEKIFLVVRQQTFTWDNPNKFKLEDYKNATDGETVFVAEEDGRIVGFISVWERDAHPFIHHLFISADHQRKGIGTLLIKSLFAWLPRPYRLKCVLKNQGAIAFYLKNHWLEIDRGIGEDGEYVLFELPVSRPFSKITLVPASSEARATIQNLGRFYVYEMSRHCGFLPTWETPSNGLFECIDLGSYCENPDRHAFVVKVDDELAGFVLINKVGSTPEVDWNIGEFFIVSKFQGKGVGSYVAEQIFNQFPGVWETSQIPENTAAIKFWDRVVSRYSHGNFEKTLKIVPEPKPHPMVILKFISQESQNIQSKENMYQVVVDYAPCHSDNEIVKEGLIKCFETQFGERDKPFSIFLKNDSGKVFGGIQAFRDTESVYIDAMWVEESLQKQGYGTKLLGAVEQEAIKNGCIFSLVDTWDFQAEEFYLKNGYERIGEIKNYWHGHSKIFLRKNIRPSPTGVL